MKTNKPDSLSLYALEKLPNTGDSSLNVLVKIDGNHPVFDGHFPGLPILPGVYLIQIIKDSLNAFLPNTYQMKSAGTVKYLKPVEPGKNNKLRLEMILTYSEAGITVSASSFLQDDSVHFKFKGEFVKS